jgi:hypothetical protein
MPRWISRFLLCIFFYSVSIYVVGRLADVLAYLLAKSGSTDLWQMLHEHIFARALLVGLLAGLVPLQIWIAAAGIFNRKFAVMLKRINPDRLKPWVFVFFSPLMILALISWAINWFDLHSRHSSVLQTTSPYPMSEFFHGFLSTNCSSAADWRVDLWGARYAFSCMIHVQLISTWVITIGYSLAPLVRKHVFPMFTMEHPAPIEEPPTENLKESTMIGKTDTP